MLQRKTRGLHRKKGKKKNTEINNAFFSTHIFIERNRFFALFSSSSFSYSVGFFFSAFVNAAYIFMLYILVFLIVISHYSMWIELVLYLQYFHVFGIQDHDGWFFLFKINGLKLDFDCVCMCGTLYVRWKSSIQAWRCVFFITFDCWMLMNFY